MLQNLEQLRITALAAIEKTQNEAELRDLEVRFLGRKGELTEILRGVAGLTAEERPMVGKVSNEVKKVLEDAVAAKLSAFEAKKLEALAETEWIDPTAPSKKTQRGAVHPISAFMEEVSEVFGQMGFETAEGPEIEDDWHNFTALNVPKDHPAREMQDTFFIKDESGNHVLRTQTSSVQIRYMEGKKPPIRIIAPGKTFRKDSDATHSPMFHQFEGLMVDKNISLPNLKSVLLTAMRRLLRNDSLELRFRLSYFPFTEPSFEVDASCAVCGGKNATCSMCKGTGWLEILGAGMVHPNVLRNCGVDPEEYTGFAFGGGVERFVMLRYGINDLRLFYENDVRFLKQFG